MAKKFLTPIQSTVSTGTAPLTIASTTAVTNLNADLLDGQHGSYYQNAGNLNAGTLLAARMPALTGDITTSAGAVATTLANTTVTAGSYGSATAVATFTVDSKGRLTAASSTNIAIAQSAVTNLTTDLAGKAPLASPTFTGTVTAPTLSLTTQDTATAATHYMVETATDGIVRPKTLANVRTEIVTTAAVNSAAATTVGTITSGTWSATDVGLAHGGTNASLTAVNGGVVYSTASEMAITSAGTAGQVLTSNGTAAPTWQTPVASGGGLEPFFLGGM